MSHTQPKKTTTTATVVEEDEVKCEFCEGKCNPETNPPYRCDGGCGAQVACGMDPDGDRICSYCGPSAFGDGVEEEEKEWETVYGSDKGQFIRYTMAGGGAHWWNYVLRKQGDRIELLIENVAHPHGRKVDGTLEINEDGNSVRQVPGDANELSYLFE